MVERTPDKSKVVFIYIWARMSFSGKAEELMSVSTYQKDIFTEVLENTPALNSNTPNLKKTT